MNSASFSLLLSAVFQASYGIQLAHETCSRAVSVVDEFHNDYCMALCEELSSKEGSDLTNEAFTNSCAIAHYKTSKGRVSPDNACFNNLIYGYSEGAGELDSIVQNLYYATPALCQLACQGNPDCVQWTWTSNLAANKNERQRCLLKSQDMVHGALDQVITSSNSTVDPQYCNAAMPLMCSSNGYKCLTCDSTQRCAWKSDLHISGWRSCAAEIDQCDGAVVHPTEDVPTHYKVCDQYVSVNPTLGNEYCIDACNELVATNGEEALDTDKDFIADCSREHYTVGDQVKPTGKCFNNLVIGYTESSTLGSMTQGLYVDTPAQCQMHCQHTPDCKSFVFVTELIASTGSQDVHRCLLKSEQMVKEALTINVAAPSPSIPTQYCNAQMPYLCRSGGYDCLSCKKGEKSCAYNSSYHIAGPTHCAVSEDPCKY